MEGRQPSLRKVRVGDPTNVKVVAPEMGGRTRMRAHLRVTEGQKKARGKEGGPKAKPTIGEPKNWARLRKNAMQQRGCAMSAISQAIYHGIAPKGPPSRRKAVKQHLL
jgi:hypothetical protein